jgi:hypothetical protein
MVQQRPNTLAGLAKIEGFGEVKAKKFGAVILNVLAKLNENQPVQQLSVKESENNTEQQTIKTSSNESKQKN